MNAICQSHPWLSFDINMIKAPPSLWIQLGEAKSKCGHLAGVPLSTSVAHRLHEVYLAKGIHATSAIEGNTLTEEKVLEIVRSHKNADNAESYEEREIINIVNATNEILDLVEEHGPKKITTDDIKTYNRKILDGLPVEDHVKPGCYSPVQVGVPGYRGAPVEKYELLMDKLCDWLNGDGFKSDATEAVIYGLIKAVIAHVYLVWIHPFGDGNGRTARILEARILLESGVPSAACHLLSDHYNKTRPRYYKELANASENGGDLIPFISYAVEGFLIAIREQILQIKNQQWLVSWVNYIHERFSGKLSKTEKRQRDLILAMTGAGCGFSVEEAKRITPHMAEEYANLTSRTVQRDLESLCRMDLAIVHEDEYYPNRDKILQFLPRARKGDIAAQIVEAVSALPDSLDLEVAEDQEEQAELFD